ncbi:hypothetical protein EJ02DRAFT_360882 [Clathrospora elynae]|uniref:Uncharacterized protein n=1 Tax=Clathrospora elynae TaxID=706981 RepID=A0A6A5S6J3_9PLEO|nr:hypothetical protein EJ02DRAFT_360882 [Clathrospora elynae]
MFRSLSSHYKKGLSTRVQDSQGLLPVKKMDFFSLFWTAWTSSFTQDHILQAFKSCGVWPMNPDPVLKKFPPPTPQVPINPEFVQLKQVTSWKDLQKLFNQVVPNKSSKEAKCLASSLHFLSVQFELVSAENRGLRVSLLGKKKHKVKEAAKINKLALQAVAAEKRGVEKERRKKEKEEKVQKLAQKKRERAEAKLAQPPPKKRKQVSESRSNRSLKKQAVKQSGGRASGVGGVGTNLEPKPDPPPKASRSGRNISLPSKFR